MKTSVVKGFGLKAMKTARSALESAERQLHDAMLQEMPVGAEVVYSHGKRLIRVTVVGHGYGDDVKVRSESSGREYWIGSSRVEYVRRLPATSGEGTR